MKITGLKSSVFSIHDICTRKDGEIWKTVKLGMDKLGVDITPLIPREKIHKVDFLLEDASDFIAKAIRSAMMCEITGYSLQLESMRCDDRSILQPAIELVVKMIRLRPEEAKKHVGDIFQFSEKNTEFNPVEVFLNNNPVLKKFIIDRMPLCVLHSNKEFFIELRMTKGKSRDMPEAFTRVGTIRFRPHMAKGSNVLQEGATSFSIGYDTYSEERDPYEPLREALSVIAEYCDSAPTESWLEDARDNTTTYITGHSHDIIVNLARDYVLKKHPDIEFAASCMSDDGAVLRVCHPEAKKMVIDALARASKDFKDLIKQI